MRGVSSWLPSLIDNHLEVLGECAGDLHRGDHEAGNRAGIVVRGEEHAQAGHCRHFTWSRGPVRLEPAVAKDQLPRRDQRLEQDASRQLRCALPALNENDRRLDDAQTGVRGDEGHVEEEGIAFGDDLVERQLGERRAAPAAVARGDVAQSQAGDRADIEVGKRTEDDAAQRPVHDADAVEVSRTNYEIGAVCRHLDHRRQVLRVVRQVGVHLADQVGVTGNRETEAFEVRDAKAALSCAMEHAHAPGKLGRKCIGNSSRAIRRLIVEHQYLGARHRQDVGDENRAGSPVRCRSASGRASSSATAALQTAARQSAPIPGPRA